MIVVKDIAYRFSIHRSGEVLRGVSFEVPPGEILAIIGPSGSGKTTLLRLITGYLKPTEGFVHLDGQPPDGRRHAIGVLYQDSRLLSWRNVIENIKLPLEILERSEDHSLLEELLGLFRLSDHGKKYPSQLSGGQQERTALARALIHTPRFLLLDEPLESTDYVHRLEIEDYIHGFVRRDGTCCILATHDLEQAVAIADRIFILGFPKSAQRSEVVEVPRRIRDAKPSVARIIPDTATFLQNILANYHRVIS